MALADLRIGGDRPWDLQVHDERFYGRVLTQASLGLGEAYMDGWWDCEQLDELICKIMRSKLNTKIRMWVQIYPVLKARLLNLRSRSRAFEIGERHYDAGNDLYERMLGPRIALLFGPYSVRSFTTLQCEHGFMAGASGDGAEGEIIPASARWPGPAPRRRR